MGVIRKYGLFKAKAPLSAPISDASHQLTEISFIVLRIETDKGITGEAYLLSFQYSPNAIKGALKDVGEVVLGAPVSDPQTVFEQVNALTEYFGQEGVNRWAQAAFNIAMWDAHCREMKEPVWKVLGGTKKAVPLYGSGGWISYSEKELVDEVVRYKERGFSAVKIKVGRPDWREDLERLKQVRMAVGPEIGIMMDANQGMKVQNAVQLALAARDLGIEWFEEPFEHTNFRDYRFLKEQTGISLAMGEREYNIVALQELIRLNALDIWQPDLLRIGGVEAWRNSAMMAKAHHLPVLPHYYKDYDIHLLCSIDNGKAAESFDWIDPLIDHPLKVVNGTAAPHDRAGWGFQFKDSVLTEL